MHPTNTLYGDLITTGRKSGKQHRVELTFAYEDDELYLLSHKRPDGTSTDWYHNLEVNPECVFEVDGKRYECKALSLEENPILEEKIRSLFKHRGGSSHYSSWYEGTSRIPVVLQIVNQS